MLPDSQFDQIIFQLNCGNAYSLCLKQILSVVIFCAPCQAILYRNLYKFCIFRVGGIWPVVMVASRVTRKAVPKVAIARAKRICTCYCMSKQEETCQRMITTHERIRRFGAHAIALVQLAVSIVKSWHQTVASWQVRAVLLIGVGRRGQGPRPP